MSRAEPLEPRRLFASLTPDVSFGDDGAFTPRAPSRNSRFDYADFVGQSPQGIYVRRNRNAGGSPIGQVTLQRFTPEGLPDATYAAPTLYGVRGVESATEAVDAQGRGVSAVTRGGGTLVVRRFAVDGTTDRSFGTRGAAMIAVPFPTDGVLAEAQAVYATVESVTAAPNGTLYAAVKVAAYDRKAGRTSQKSELLALRFTAGGTLDAGFGRGGYVRLGRVSTDLFRADSLGRLVVVNSTTNTTFVASRYLADGTPDVRFARRGRFGFDRALPAENADPSLALSLDAQDRLLIGRAYPRITLTRLTTNGRYDDTFGKGGVVDLGATGRVELFSAFTQDDGKIVALVDPTPYVGGEEAIVRLTPSGRADRALDGDGRATIVDGAGADDLRLFGRLSDGSYFTSLTTRAGSSLQKLTELSPVRLGESGTLRITATDAADTVTVVVASNGGTRVTLNGTSTAYGPGRVKAIVADLGDGDNAFDSTVNVPTTVQGGNDDDTIRTGDADDLVYGSPLYDNDEENGSTDVFQTRGGRDSILFDNSAKVAIDAGPGGGTVSGGYGDGFGSGTGEVTLVGSGADWDVSLGGRILDVTLTGTGRSIRAYANERATLNLQQLTGDYEVLTGPGDDGISTGDGDQRVISLGGRDSIRTGPGNDFVGRDFELGYPTPGSGQDDYIDLGPGNDVVRDGDGDNTVLGGDGNDRISTGGGRDSVLGNAGRDTVVGGDGNDTVYGGADRDRIDGGGGNDEVFGEGADDRIEGNAGDDTLAGGVGRDTLLGGVGNDVLYGYEVRVFGRSANVLDGGPGRDRYQRESDDDVLTAVETRLFE